MQFDMNCKSLDQSEHQQKVGSILRLQRVFHYKFHTITWNIKE